MLGGGAIPNTPGLMPPEPAGESNVVKVPSRARIKPWMGEHAVVLQYAPAISPFVEIEATYVNVEPGGSKIVKPPVGVRKKPCCTPLASA
jgi:hypothetical protein